MSDEFATGIKKESSDSFFRLIEIVTVFVGTFAVKIQTVMRKLHVVVFSDLLGFVIFLKRFVKFYVVNEARFLKINVCFINENNYFKPSQTLKKLNYILKSRKIKN